MWGSVEEPCGEQCPPPPSPSVGQLASATSRPAVRTRTCGHPASVCLGGLPGRAGPGLTGRVNCRIFAFQMTTGRGRRRAVSLEQLGNRFASSGGVAGSCGAYEQSINIES